MKWGNKIFIIDDNEVDCLIAKMLIQKAHPRFTIDSFFSPQPALETIQFRLLHNKEELPNKIILDLDMPLKSGWDFLVEYQSLISNLTFQLPAVYILTASIDHKDLVKSKDYPFVKAFLVKPLTNESIKLIVQKHLIS